ncbi:MAG: hypothetical protein IJB57_10340 [Clostridia bacterium]|nr:hypothetical protein [Clostridia bacterium]
MKGKVSVYIENSRPIITLFDHPDVADTISNNSEMSAYYDRIASAEGELTSYISDVYSVGSALTFCYTEESKYVNVTSNIFTFDITTGDMLSLTDILLPDTEEKLISMFCDKMSQSPYSYFVSPEDAVKDVFISNRRIWGLCKGGLYIRFAPYDVASYGLGYINVVLAYDLLEGIVKPEYLPNTTRYNGEAVLSDVYYIKDHSIIYGQKSSYGVKTESVCRDVSVYRNKRKGSEDSEKGELLFYSNIFTSDEYVNLPDDGGKYILDQPLGRYMTGIEIEDGSLLTFGIDK